MRRKQPARKPGFFISPSVEGRKYDWLICIDLSAVLGTHTAKYKSHLCIVYSSSGFLALPLCSKLANAQGNFVNDVIDVALDLKNSEENIISTETISDFICRLKERELWVSVKTITTLVSRLLQSSLMFK